MKLELEEVNCPGCGSTQKSVLTRVLLSPLAVDSSLIQCSHCRLAFVSPRPTKKTEDEFYKSEYFKKEDPGVWKDHRMPFFEFAIRKIETMWSEPKRKKLIDIGCGGGFFLEIAKERSWEVSGVDPSVDAVRYARDYLGIEVYKGGVLEVEIPRSSYSIATLWNVLDQMSEPALELKKVAEWIEPGGLLFARISNLDCHLAVHRLWSLVKRFGLLNVKRNEPTVFHLVMFNSETVRRFLQEAQFDVLEIDNAPMDFYQEDLMNHFGKTGSILLQRIYWMICRLVKLLSFGRFIIGPSLWVAARKR